MVADGKATVVADAAQVAVDPKPYSRDSVRLCAFARVALSVARSTITNEVVLVAIATCRALLTTTSPVKLSVAQLAFDLLAALQGCVKSDRWQRFRSCRAVAEYQRYGIEKFT